jgi:hypothetical protein
MHTQSDIALGCERGLAGVHSHPYSNVDLLRPQVFGDGPLRRQRCGDGVLRATKDDEEGVSLGIDLAAAVLGEERTEEVVMLPQQVRVVLAETLQEPRRPFDVGEEEGDGAAR